MQIKRGVSGVFIALNLLALSAIGAEPPITLTVDATDAPRNLLHVRLHIPATPGKLTLFYPKWIPGEHMPGGPINDVTGLKFSANGQPLDWQRNAEDMFQFNLTVPAGANAVEVALDFLLSAGGSYSAGSSATARLLDLNWNQVVLYPKSSAPLATTFAARLKLPPGWKFGTALPVDATTRSPVDEIQFAPAPLETLIDSPVIAGEFSRTVELDTIGKAPHRIHLVADTAAALEIKPEDKARFNRLVHEANALFGAHHYRGYHFLVTMSDHVAHFGLEHHESSDDRLAEKFLTDEDARKISADLMPHELVHSWNGKYRRPAGLATPDYQQPMRADLIWIYEGLTDYLGKVLAVRSGLATNTDFRASIAMTAAMLEHRAGRDWRSLADTAVSAQLVYTSGSEGISRRRGTDFYSEGDLIWLEVDTRIRQQTHGEKSIDDFCKRFHGGENSPPKVVPYDLEEVVQALNAVAPGDWKKFFDERIYAITAHAPLGGIENAGWRLAYTNELPASLKLREGQRQFTDMNYSLGFTLGNDGGIGDVRPGSPADKAGIFQGMKLVAVDGRAWSAKILREAVKTAATNDAPIGLLTVNDDFYKTIKVDYHGGEKYPVLERDPAKPDLLAEIVKPLTPERATRPPAKK